MEITMISLKNDFISVDIAEMGAELKSLVFSGIQYVWEGRREVWGSSAPIMFPICGGLRDDKFTYNDKEYTLPKHGYAKTSLFEIESRSDSSVTLLHKSSDATKKNYPFDYEFRVVYTLEGKSLKVSYDVKNLTDGEMYFSVGAHEGYYTPEGIEDYDVIFPEEETLSAYVLYGNLLSEQRLPIIKQSKVLPLYDKYFTVDALGFKDLKSRSATLRNRKNGRALRVDFPNADYFLLWHKPASPYICLEPWAGVQQPVNSSYDITEKEGIIKLEKGGEYSFKHTITIVE
jgi:galactose mutarotase-like enzyme